MRHNLVGLAHQLTNTLSLTSRSAAVALEDSTLQSVRNVQYRDRDGNVIGMLYPVSPCSSHD